MVKVNVSNSHFNLSAAIIYFASSEALQYLEQEDSKRYLNALIEHRDHFSTDPSYLRVFHEQHLIRGKSDKKKDAE
jgi:U3 small nucleolar RNA-associated protein 10